MAKTDAVLTSYAWPVSRLGELIETLSRRSRLIPRPGKLTQPPESLAGAGEETISKWIDVAAGQIGLEVEIVTSYYADVEQLLRSGSPAILRLPTPHPDAGPLYLALLKYKRKARLLGPDLRLHGVRTEVIRDALCYPYEAGLLEEVDQLLLEAGVSPERVTNARRAILRQQLSAVQLPAGWILRLPPGASIWQQFRHAGIYRPFVIMFTMYFLQIMLSVASWYVIGRGVFMGHFDLGWLLAWALLLLSTIPVQIFVGDAQNELSLTAGAIFKQRLLHGSLKLEPEEIRHQGMGQFLGRVMESEAVEMLALSGGFMALLSFVELGIAGFILYKGAGGILHASLLALWTLVSITILWRYYEISRDWAVAYREMTNDLVERMVGHRTRRAQENPHRWHEDEDQALDRYLKLSESVDHVNEQLSTISARGWLVVGMLGVIIPFTLNTASPQTLAISLGGVLLASQALSKLVGGAQSLMNLFIAWGQVGPLFAAAARPRELQSLDLVSLQQPETKKSPSQAAAPVASGAPRPLLIARELTFRYRPHGHPVIQEVSLQVQPGDRLLLEGPSGGGKSTLAALLTGLRKPESGSLILWGFDRQILGSEEWRRRVVMAPQFQENHVYSDTFGFNLLMGRRWPPEPEDLQDAEAVCRELGLGEVLDRMPSGFNQMLGESGWQLSHGERSRLYIARTLLQKADLIVLDESFAALDPENLYRSLRTVLQRAPSLLVIAHP